MKQYDAQELQQLLEWTKEKTHDGNLPPWAWYQYMKLDETLTAIIRGMEATVIREDLQRAEEHPESGLRLVDDKFRPNSAQLRPALEDLPLPM